MSLPILDPTSKSITFYEESSGKILGTVTGGHDTIELNKEKAEHPFVEGSHDSESFYVSEGQVRARPEMPIELIEGVFHGVPIPCAVYVNGVEYLCNEDTLEISFDQPGTYRVTFNKWPFFVKEFTLENPSQ